MGWAFARRCSYSVTGAVKGASRWACSASTRYSTCYLLLLCAECVPCNVALLLYTGVENECRMAEGVSVLLTQHQRVVVERQDQGGVVVDPAECLLAGGDLPAFRVCGIHPGGEGIQKGEKGWRKFA